MKDRGVHLKICGAVLITAAVAATAFAQQFITKAPTAADWAAMAKLPDFNGVWERGGGGAPRGGAAAPAAGAPRGNAAAPAGAAPQRGAGQAGQGRGAAAGRGGGAGGGRG